MSHDDAPVVCGTFWNMIDAHIAKGRLQAEGVPAFLDNEHFVTADWFVNIVVGGVKLLVPPSYAQQAALVLKGIHDGEFTLDELDAPPLP